ncbi:hypothetical protein C8R47DRAFT_1129782 [Mycena vitilis]|nr:hypothetical protein C8R47DRAFT_1129782 [Mycena vitilis]
MPSLPDLPTELLMEIVKYYPELNLDVDACIHPGRPVGEQFQGNDSLRALSQTCRALRDIFVPVLWARVHACFTSRNRPKRRIRTRAKMLERRMIGIQKTPYVAPCIRWMAVTMLECNMSNWQPIAEFIRVLDLLPNLKDLTILQASTEMIPVLETSFYGKVFPSVSKLTLTDRFTSIMRCFPNVQVLAYFHHNVIEVFDVIKEHCKSIHTIRNIQLSAEVVRCLRDAIPNVKSIFLWYNLRLDTLRLLEGMDNLSELRIRLNPTLVPSVADTIQVAERVLRTSKACGRKELRIEEFVRGQTVQKETLIVVSRGT